MRLLGIKDEEMESIRKELIEKESRLREVQEELGGVKMELDGERLLREGFEKSREGWKGWAKAAYGDTEGLRAKIGTLSSASIVECESTDTVRSRHPRSSPEGRDRDGEQGGYHGRQDVFRFARPAFGQSTGRLQFLSGGVLDQDVRQAVGVQGKVRAGASL